MKLIKILTAFIALISLQIAAAQWLNVPPPAEAKNLMVFTAGVPVVGGSNPSFTAVNGKFNGGSNNVELTGVTAGNLVAVFYGASGNPPTNAMTCSDGTSTLTKATTATVGIYSVGQWFYILAANSGDRTYTISVEGANAVQATMALEFDYTGTIVLDKQNNDHGADTTAVTTGSITTTGGANSQLILAGSSVYAGGNQGSYLIAGTAADSAVETLAGDVAVWYRIVTANTTGAGTATDSSTGASFSGQIISFKGQ